jgi:HPt (histidine-containing phosphotransfer) domain-containing protein
MITMLMDSLGQLQMTELMHGFMLKAEEIIGALQDQITLREAETIRDRGHELKGMAANFGIKNLSALANIIEASSIKGDLATALDTIQKLPAELVLTREAIMTLLKTKT